MSKSIQDYAKERFYALLRDYEKHGFITFDEFFKCLTTQIKVYNQLKYLEKKDMKKWLFDN